MPDDELYLHHLKNLIDSQDENVLEKIYDFFPGIVYVYNTDTKKLRYVNKKITDLLGFSFDDIKTWDNDFTRVIFKEDVALVQQELEKLGMLKDEESHTYQCRFNCKDKDWIHFQVIGKVLKRDEQGKVASLLMIARDIEHEVQSGEDLKVIQDLADYNEELLQFGNWDWAPATEILKWSSGMYKLMDSDPATKQPMTMRQYLDHVVPKDRTPIEKALDTASRNKDKTVTLEYSVITGQGNEKVFHSKGKLLYDADESVTRIVGTTRDITQLRQQELKRELKITALDRSNKELEDFAYAAAHDLQEPLRKISTLSDRLQSRFSEVLPDEAKNYLDRIQIAAKNSQSLIDSLMEFSRITHEPGDHKETDLDILLEEIKSDLELKTEETHATIRTVNLPTIEGSTLQFKQLFTNILLNSIKFRIPDTAPVIEIKSKLLAKAELKSYHLDPAIPHYLITVKDNGIGFEEAYATKIFQMFSRLHGKSAYPGAGIGLALCKKIVENHHGRIFAKGIPGEGSVFSIILPAKQI